MHNLGTVFRFEVIRTLKKKTFWIMAIIFPVAMAAIYAVAFFSGQATEQAALDTQKQKFSFVVTDDSGLINKDILKSFEASETSDKQATISKVINGSLDAYFYYPKDLSKEKVEIYAKDAGLFDDSRYQGVANAILQSSVSSTVSPQQLAVLKGSINYSSTLYKNGALYDGYKELIAPGIFLALFYILIVVFGNQMLASTTEEKENRVIEIILTTIKAKTLILGKILSLLTLALIQVVIILVPIIIAYVFFRNQLSLPDLNLNDIPLNPLRIAIGALMFTFSFLLFTGILVAIGAAVPTVKEASGFFGAAMILMFGPLYAVTLFISAPESDLVKFLTFFPLTAPIPLMLRNAVGNLTIPDATIGIAILVVSSIAALALAVRVFRYGALEYSNIVSLKSIFRK